MKVKDFFTIAPKFKRRLQVFAGGDFVGVVDDFSAFSQTLKKKMRPELITQFLNGFIIESLKGFIILTKSGASLDIYIL